MIIADYRWGEDDYWKSCGKITNLKALCDYIKKVKFSEEFIYLITTKHREYYDVRIKTTNESLKLISDFLKEQNAE